MQQDQGNQQMPALAALIDAGDEAAPLSTPESPNNVEFKVEPVAEDESPSLDRMPQLKQLILGGGGAETDSDDQTTSAVTTAATTERTDDVVNLDDDVVEERIDDRDDAGDDAVVEPLEQLLAEGTIPTSRLGTVLDVFRLRWTELMTSTVTSVGYKPPDVEHLKENSEFLVARLKESAKKLDAELTRTIVQWSVRCPEVVLQEELNHLNKCIERQKQLLTRVDNGIMRRLHQMNDS